MAVLRGAILVVWVLLLGSGQHAGAQAIYGAGLEKCSKWLETRRHDGPETARKLGDKFQLQAWLDGFLVGHNLANPGGPDFLIQHKEAEGFYLWLDNYCATNPLDHVVEGAMKLVKELQTRARRSAH